MSEQTRRFYEFGQYRLDVEQHQLLRDGQVVQLPPKVIDTLVALVEQSGRIISKDDLMRKVWRETYVEEGNLVVNISQLRKTLGQREDGKPYIETIPKRGYRFAADVREVWDDTADLVVKEYTATRITIEEHESGRAEKIIAVAQTGELLDTQLPDAQGAALARQTMALPQRYTRSKKAAAALAAIVILAIASLGYLLLRSSEKNSATPFEAMQITRLTNVGKVWRAAISPDGKYVAYVVKETEKQSLWVRQVATTANVQIIPPEDVMFWGVTFSHDGNHIYFVKGDKKSRSTIYQVAVLGGPITKLIEAVNAPFAVSPDGRQFAFVRQVLQEKATGLIVANADGSGERTLATRRAPDFFSPNQDGIAWSPDGRVIACHAGGMDEGGYYRNVVGVQVEDGAERPITSKRWKWIGGLGWLADGTGLLLTASDHPAGWDVRQIWQIAYPDGEARRVTNDLSGYAGMSLTEDARTVLTIQETTLSSIWIMPGAEAGQARLISSGTSDGREGVAWTPDGRIVYTSKASGNNDQHIWIMDEDGGNQKQLTTIAGLHGQPAVTADGRYIVYMARAPDDMNANIWRMDADGSNLKQLTAGGYDVRPQCSPDGRWVVYTHRITPGMSTLWKVPLAGGEPAQLEDVFAYGNAVSPDGHLVACGYWGQKSNWQSKIALIPFDGGPPVKLFDLPPHISLYLMIQWRPDGQALIFSSEDTPKIWMQPLAGGPPKELINFQSDSVWRFAHSPDGKQLAVARGTIISDVVLISNFK